MASLRNGSPHGLVQERIYLAVWRRESLSLFAGALGSWAGIRDVEMVWSAGQTWDSETNAMAMGEDILAMKPGSTERNF